MLLIGFILGSSLQGVISICHGQAHLSDGGKSVEGAQLRTPEVAVGSNRSKLKGIVEALASLCVLVQAQVAIAGGKQQSDYQVGAHLDLTLVVAQVFFFDHDICV